MVGDEEYEEIFTYNQILDTVEDWEDGEDELFKFNSIDGHQGPLTRHKKNYKGSM